MGRQANLKRLKRTLRRALAREEAEMGGGVVDVLSQQAAPALPLPWAGQPEARKEAIESLDNFAPLRNTLRSLSEEQGEWAGIPIPIESEELVIEPSYPFAPCFARKPHIDENKEGWKLRNHFHSNSKRSNIYIFGKDDPNKGPIKWAWSPAVHHLLLDLQTVGCAVAWGIEQESNAVRMLGTMLRHHQFKTYMLTGMFLESSKRSGLMYLFRRLKPTVVITPHQSKTESKVLCSLCMHPIGFYAQSWAGAMTPTDDVIAHLSMMRADEHMLWRRCNQHEPHQPEAGL